MLYQGSNRGLGIMLTNPFADQQNRLFGDLEKFGDVMQAEVATYGLTTTERRNYATTGDPKQSAKTPGFMNWIDQNKEFAYAAAGCILLLAVLKGKK